MNPLNLAREVEERYRRYLKTTFYFKDRDLRASFEDTLVSGHLSKGPYLEATPVFKRAQAPETLFPSLLGYRPDEGFIKAVAGDRPLYQHQQEAIQGALYGSNVVVASGTGSGKTEAFIYPVLLHLYQEFHAGRLGPGVRAVVLYPMNALANDQRERLGEICRQLKEANSPFRFSFGQYIGETPEDEGDSRRHARDHMAHRLPGELVLRSEIRTSLPHILLTNYSMLEYLLVRPADSPLFDNGRAHWWKFLVLDEAHQYRGSRGIEMAMLLRRLKQRLREGGRSEPFRCIVTSATLAGGEGDRAGVAKFASDLFGEEFRGEHVLLGETEPIPGLGPESLPPHAYRLLLGSLHGEAAETGSHISEMAARLGSDLQKNEDTTRAIGRLLQRDRRAATIRRLSTRGPVEVNEIADEVFDDLPDKERVSALSGIVDLLVQAKDPVSDSPLLSARYHLLLRSLEGAFVSYWPQKRVFLDRKAGDGEEVAFEVALCRECGQHYFVGPKDFKGGRLGEAIRDPSHLNFGATFFRPIEGNWDGEEDEENSRQSGRESFQLCVRCGELRQGPTKCGHQNSIIVIKEDPPADEDRADQMARCSACGYNAAGRDPVREVIHGADGPNAVIATTLYQHLPADRRKVLAFADGRQEAAFFAWYLEDTYRDILGRNLMLQTVQRLSPHAPAGLSLRELATGLRGIFRERNVFPPATGDLELRRAAWLGLYREFVTDEPRISLEGVGLVRWSVEWPSWFKDLGFLKDPPWSLGAQEAFDLLAILLDSMRMDKAVELRIETGISLSWSDLGTQAWQTRVLMNEKGKLRKGERRWNGRTGKRARFLAELLMRSDVSEDEALDDAVKALREIWEAANRSDEAAPSAQHRLLLSVDDARRLNPDWWRLHLLADDDLIFACDTCGRYQAVSVRNVCPRHRCPGTLKAISLRSLERNHYRILYEEHLPSTLRVEEHTAQLDKEKAREFQREFRDGRIHVLSCSTTFELGVDLGDLDTIFLRNVPPEAFNYAQRVGRAGRRRGFPGFAITYCRRGPHDLYHFSEPDRMLSGKVGTPTLALRNEKIIVRHAAATALSAFFRNSPLRFRTVEDLFVDLASPRGVADFVKFLHEHRAELEEVLVSVIPSPMHGPVGLTDGSWLAKVAGDESRFLLAESEIASDYRTVKMLERESAGKEDYDTAKWAKMRAKTIAAEDVLSFLSRKAVIPKYGFPVDVVELDTQRSQQGQAAFEVLLERDLAIAIAEFAPTSKLVANKKVWTSYGLKRVSEKEWPRKLYKRCVRHNVFYQWEWGEPEPPTLCGDRLQVAEYLIPRFGFVTSRDRPSDPTSRPARVFTTRPYFTRVHGPDPGSIDVPSAGSPLITMRRASPGLMTVLCEGRRGEGFYVCRTCGAGFRTREKTHVNPTGQGCQGTLDLVSLGHEFVTDVLQLNFHPKPEGDAEVAWFAFSLAFALVEGAAEVLEVPSTDLSATVAYGTEADSTPPIILYDNVPGGAGLVARLEGKEILRACLEASLKRVKGDCGCAESTSCYGCLRNYRNQFAHQNLKRGPAKRYLTRLLTEWT